MYSVRGSRTRAAPKQQERYGDDDRPCYRVDELVTSLNNDLRLLDGRRFEQFDIYSYIAEEEFDLRAAGWLADQIEHAADQLLDAFDDAVRYALYFHGYRCVEGSLWVGASPP